MYICRIKTKPNKPILWVFRPMHGEMIITLDCLVAPRLDPPTRNAWDLKCPKAAILQHSSWHSGHILLQVRRGLASKSIQLQISLAGSPWSTAISRSDLNK